MPINGGKVLPKVVASLIEVQFIKHLNPYLQVHCAYGLLKEVDSGETK
jgi:hypothetical protein